MVVAAASPAVASAGARVSLGPEASPGSLGGVSADMSSVASLEASVIDPVPVVVHEEQAPVRREGNVRQPLRLRAAGPKLPRNSRNGTVGARVAGSVGATQMGLRTGAVPIRRNIEPLVHVDLPGYPAAPVPTHARTAPRRA